VNASVLDPPDPTDAVWVFPSQLLTVEVLRRPVESTLTAVIAMDHRLLWPRVAVGDGHAQGIGDQRGGLVAVDRPAHHPAGEHIQHDAAVHLAFPGGMLGDIGHPQLVWCRPVEATLNQVRGGRDGGLAPEGPSGSWQAVQALNPHDLADRLAVDDHAAAIDQLGVDSPPAVGAPRVGVDGPHQLCQPDEPELAWRG
jgi:hypothetical protein